MTPLVYKYYTYIMYIILLFIYCMKCLIKSSYLLDEYEKKIGKLFRAKAILTRMLTAYPGVRCRVALVFLVKTNQNVKNIPSDHKLYLTAINYSKRT
jgi:hypothetical protein